MPLSSTSVVSSLFHHNARQSGRYKLESNYVLDNREKGMGGDRRIERNSGGAEGESFLLFNPCGWCVGV